MARLPRFYLWYFLSKRCSISLIMYYSTQMYRGGAICLTIHFKPLWAKNVPHFGIAHALAMGVREPAATTLRFRFQYMYIFETKTKTITQKNNVKWIFACSPLSHSLQPVGAMVGCRSAQSCRGGGVDRQGQEQTGRCRRRCCCRRTSIRLNRDYIIILRFLKYLTSFLPCV
jgi:hypothetical protein